MVARYLVGNSHCQADNIDCEIVDAGFQRALALHLQVPASPLSAIMSNEAWEEVYQQLVELVNTHDTTLIFVNTRRLAERLALALADRLGEAAVCAHHGSMSKELRHSAEQKLKSGVLKVLVATASMELGIDIGAVDLVVQFASPKSIATLMQRVGRSGHSIDGTPKGVLFPLTRDDLVEATALLHSIRCGELDCIVMPEKPLDILAQQIVAEVSSPVPDSPGDDAMAQHQAAANGAGRDMESLYRLFANAYPYRRLSRDEFDRIVTMLAEGYSTRRGRQGAWLHLDAVNHRLRARRGANLIALTNGGAIPDMFDYQVVLDPEDVVVGSLNEDFALEALPGDVFTLGTHAWQLLRIDGLKARVRDATGMQPTVPFWFGEGPGRTRELSQSVSRLRQSIAALLMDESAEAAITWLMTRVGLPAGAASQLVEYLQAGMTALGVMPSRETLVMERFFDEVGDMHLVVHSPYGSRLNRAWGLALRKRFCQSFNFELQAAANEDSIVISLGSVHSFALEEVYGYLQAATVRDTLVQALLDAPMFEVRWRWNATRSLAIQRNRNGNRVPPQFQRMDAEDLIAQVFPDQIACQENLTGKRDVPDHPLVRQTIHDCLTEAMDIDELESLVQAIENKELRLIARDLREPSPFAREIINARPYAFLDDAPFEERRTNAVRYRSWSDPAQAKDFSQLDAAAIKRVKQEAWPLVCNQEELHDALLSARYFTLAEMHQPSVTPGLAAQQDMTRNQQLKQQWQQHLQQSGRLLQLHRHRNGLWCAAESLPLFQGVFGRDISDHVLPQQLQSRQWDADAALREIVRGRLACLGPVTVRQLAEELALPESEVEQALLALEVEGFAFRGQFTPVQPPAHRQTGDNEQKQPTASATEWCERRLLQRIHRYTIDHHRQQIKPVSLATYTRFLFAKHQLVAISQAVSDPQPALTGQTSLQNCLHLLDGISAPAISWEADILPARIPDYDPDWLDVLCISGKVVWGRYVLPMASRRHQQSKLPSRHAGPVKSTPIALLQRTNIDIWQALAAARATAGEVLTCSKLAQRIEQDLRDHGASFFDQIQVRTGFLKTQLEQGLAELVSLGRVGSDSFTGLRALLVPSHRRAGNQRRRGRPVMFGVEDAGRWSALDTWLSRDPGPGEAAAGSGRRWQVLDEEQLQRLVIIYLHRWGVLFRGLLERELLAPPWRVLLPMLRRLELRGVLRGGRFVDGVGGEQFAFAETIDGLRKFNGSSDAVYFSLAATDPLNLINLLLPMHKIPRLSKNRVLYQGGVPVAVLESGKVQFLRQFEAGQQWELQQLLTCNRHPLRLGHRGNKNPVTAGQ